MTKAKLNLCDDDDNDPAARPDEENPEWTSDDFKKARPALEVMTKVFGTAAAESLRRGRPAKSPEEKTVRLTLRVDADVVEA